MNFSPPPSPPKLKYGRGPPPPKEDRVQYNSVLKGMTKRTGTGD